MNDYICIKIFVNKKLRRFAPTEFCLVRLYATINCIDKRQQDKGQAYPTVIAIKFQRKQRLEIFTRVICACNPVTINKPDNINRQN